MKPDEQSSKPGPHADEPPPDARETVAPKNAPQSEFVLNKLEDLLRKNQITPQLEKDMGMSKSQIEQFVEKYRPSKNKQEPRAAREITVKPGENRTLKPSELPGIDRSKTFSRGSRRDRGSLPQDTERGGNIEGTRGAPPREIKSRYEAYMQSLSRSKGAKPARPAADSGAGGR